MRLIFVLLAVLFVLPSFAKVVDTPHPFILWTRDEAVQLRTRVETEPWAKETYAKMRQETGNGRFVANLFAYSVMGDRAAGEEEKRELLRANVGLGENTATVLRYDVLYDMLTPDERAQIEDKFRALARRVIGLGRNTLHFDRMNWLPNMAFNGPAFFGAHLACAAMKDEALTRELWNTPNVGLKWYFDVYLCDSGFYNEEFNKMFSTPGIMMLYCRAVGRTGLDDIGFGYTDKRGSGMRGHLESIIRLGYPLVDLGTTRPQYPMVTIGDTRGGRGLPGYPWQSAIINGYLSDGSGGNGEMWTGAGATGGNKPTMRLWFEMAARQWPDAGFQYFLAQMRKPDEDKYYPSLLFNLDPIDPKAVKAPPAPSGDYRERGVVVLRADESPAYWESAAPAVAMRHATPYVHHALDGFSLAGFYAFNRPIYVNRQVSSNYAGVDPTWSYGIHSHCGVSVDNQNPAEIGEAETRDDFSPLVKFHAARVQDAFPGVDMTRGLFLTKEYLFDVFALASPRPHAYQWAVHTLGKMCPDNPNDWGPTQQLVGTQSEMTDERSYSSSNNWGVTAVQYTAGADPELSALGARWFVKPRVGVHVRMLGEDGTTAYTATSPVYSEGQDRFMYGADEPGGASILAARSGRNTAFVALHEPFKGGAKVAEFQRIGQTEDAVCAVVRGAEINDRVMLRWGEKAKEPVTFSAGGESFTFSDHAFIRITRDKVEIAGDIKSCRIRVEGAPTLVINGKPVAAAPAGGFLAYGAIFNGPGDAPALVPAVAPGPIASWWKPGIMCLPSDGKGTATLKLRNNGATEITQDIVLRTSPGVKTEPAIIKLAGLKPGEELDVPVTITPDKTTYNKILTVELTSEGAAAVQLAALTVVHGLSADRSLVRPNDFAQTVYAPRYIAKYYFMQSALPRVLLDPDGMRRFESGDVPTVKVLQKSADGKESWQPVKYGNLSHMWLHQVKPYPNQPLQLDEAGQHPHGFRSPFEHRFTEDWIWLRCKDAGASPVVYDWFTNVRDPRITPSIAAVKLPTKIIVAVDEEMRDVAISAKGDWSMPPNTKSVTAIFRRQAGFRYGQVMLYPASSAVRGNEVTVPGTDGVAFAFCLEEEFPALVKLWQNQPPFVPVRAQKSGEIWPEWP